MKTLQIDKGALYNAYFYLRRYSPYFHHMELISAGDVEHTIELFRGYLKDFEIADLNILPKSSYSSLGSGRYLVGGWYNYYKHILGEKAGIYAIRRLSELGILRVFYVVMLKDFLNYRDLDNHDYMKRLTLGEEGIGVLSYRDILGYTEYIICLGNEFSNRRTLIKYREAIGKAVADILKEFIVNESNENNIGRYVNLNPIDYQSDYTVLEGKDGPREISDYLYFNPFPTRVSNIIHWIIQHLDEDTPFDDSDLTMVSKFEKIPSLYDRGIRNRLLKAMEVENES